MKDKIRISLNEEKMEVLLGWIFGDFKPIMSMPQDRRLISQLKNACQKLGLEEEWKEWNTTEEEDVEAKKERLDKIDEIRDDEGIFYCSVCKVRTSQKTPTTTCIVCNTSLRRG